MTTNLTGVAARLEKLPRVIVDDAMKAFEKTAMDQVVRAIGSETMHMHTRRGRRPVKLSVVTNVSGSGALINGFANGRPSGVWTWLESGTKPHQEGRGSYLKAPNYGHPIKGPIEHHGSRGKRTWTKAIAEFEREFPDLALKDLRKAISG